MEKQEKCIIGENLGHTVPSIHFFIGLLSQEACLKVADQEEKKKVLDMKMHQAYPSSGCNYSPGRKRYI